MSGLVVLILASGASSRMRGRDKLLEKVGDRPLLQVICDRAARAGLPVFVTVPDLNHPRSALTGAATLVSVPDAAEGMAAAIRRGVAALPQNCAGVMILPADMPEIETEDLKHMAAQFQGESGPIQRATAEDGTAGHPVLFPRRLFAALGKVRGDQGARAVLEGEAVHFTALPARHATTDLDTPEAWAQWRASQHET